MGAIAYELIPRRTDKLPDEDALLGLPLLRERRPTPASAGVDSPRDGCRAPKPSQAQGGALRAGMTDAVDKRELAENQRLLEALGSR